MEREIQPGELTVSYEQLFAMPAREEIERLLEANSLRELPGAVVLKDTAEIRALLERKDR